jgi:hypothetical protein
MPSSGMIRHVALLTSSVLRLLVNFNIFHSSPIVVTLKMVALRSSETSVLIKATQLNNPDVGILHSDRHENHKLYAHYILFNSNFYSMVFKMHLYSHKTTIIF